MNYPTSLHKRFSLCALLPMALILISWSASSGGGADPIQNRLDTVPSQKKPPTLKEAKMTPEKKGKGENNDWDNVDREVEKSLQKIEREIKIREADLKIINEKVEESVKDIDLEKIKKETSQTMQQASENVDFKIISTQVEKALTEVSTDLEKVRENSKKKANK
jgi:hypothetical protein